MNGSRQNRFLGNQIFGHSSGKITQPLSQTLVGLLWKAINKSVQSTFWLVIFSSLGDPSSWFETGSVLKELWRRLHLPTHGETVLRLIYFVSLEAQKNYLSPFLIYLNGWGPWILKHLFRSSKVILLKSYFHTFIKQISKLFFDEQLCYLRHFWTKQLKENLSKIVSAENRFDLLCSKVGGVHLQKVNSNLSGTIWDFKFLDSSRYSCLKSRLKTLRFLQSWFLS